MCVLQVPELRDALADLGLDTKGNKPVLVARLKEHLAKDQGRNQDVAADQGRNLPGPAAEYDPTEPTEDTEPRTEFGEKAFVNVNPRGISFSLSAPRPAKPAPPPQRPPSPGPQLESPGLPAARRSGAAAFFLNEVGEALGNL